MNLMAWQSIHVDAINNTKSYKTTKDNKNYQPPNKTDSNQLIG